MTRTSTFARTELVRTQLLWTDAELNPDPTADSRRLIREAFDRSVFKWAGYFALGSDRLCYAALRISLDLWRHREELRVHPQVAASSAWVDRIAPDLHVLVEEFAALVARFGLRVVSRMGVQRGSLQSLGAARGPAIVWVGGPTRDLTKEVRGLAELTMKYALSESLPELAE